MMAGQAQPARDWLLFVVLLVDAVVLAILELFFLPLRLGVIEFPVTALLAAVTMPWLVARAADVSRRAMVAGAPLWVWLLAVAVIGVAGPGGDAVLLADWRSVLLLAAGVLPAGVVLGRVAARAGADRR
jgi:hypothetical protein